jgi:hypothetical protein
LLIDYTLSRILPAAPRRIACERAVAGGFANAGNSSGYAFAHLNNSADAAGVRVSFRSKPRRRSKPNTPGLAPGAFFDRDYGNAGAELERRAPRRRLPFAEAHPKRSEPSASARV